MRFEEISNKNKSNQIKYSPRTTRLLRDVSFPAPIKTYP
jgi:hypothetical protein